MSDLKQSALARRLAAREAAATSASDNTIKSDLRTSVAQLQKNLESLSSYSNETKNLLNYNLDVTIPSSLAKQVVDITDVANPASIASRLGTAETSITSLTSDKASAIHTHSISALTGVNTATLLGRWDAGIGTAQEVTLGSGLSLSGSGVLTANSIGVDSSRTISTGLGLLGGGDLSANRTLSVDFATSGTSSATQAVRADDSRLSNTRTPTSHTHSGTDITTGTVDTARLSVGSSAGTVCAGNDARLSDSRTPTAHTHSLGDLTQSSASPNQVPQWNGTNWVPATLSGSGSPGGSTGQIQYNNASAFAGASYVKINSDNLELVKPASEPTTAPVDSIVMYTKSIGQRDLPAFVDSSGWATNLQTCIARNKFSPMFFNAGTTTAPGANGMVFTATSVGTGNTTAGSVAITTTSLLAGSRRSSFLTANTSGNAAGWRASVAQCWRGNGTGRGGFFCVWKFGIGDATAIQANATLFVGLNDSTLVPDATAITNPVTTVNASMSNSVGLVLYGGSTTYGIVYRSGTSAASTITLTGLTANLTDIVEFCLYAAPNDTTIHYYVKIYANSGSNQEVSGNIGTSGIPANTTLFVPHCWRGRTSTATAAVAVHCHTFSVEQPH